MDLEAIARGESDDENEGDYDGDLFANADEFAHLLEEGDEQQATLKRQVGWEDRATKRRKGLGKGTGKKQAR